MTPGELSTLFSLCAEDRNPTCGARDAAALALLYGAGLRRSEAVSLELTDFDRETGALTGCGKGRKERTAYLDAGAREGHRGMARVSGERTRAAADAHHAVWQRGEPQSDFVIVRAIETRREAAKK